MKRAKLYLRRKKKGKKCLNEDESSVKGCIPDVILMTSKERKNESAATIELISSWIQSGNSYRGKGRDSCGISGIMLLCTYRPTLSSMFVIDFHEVY